MARDLPAQTAECARAMAEQGWDEARLLRDLVYIFRGSLCLRQRLAIAWAALR